MSEPNRNRIQRFIHRLKDRYHLSVVNKNQFVEVFSTNISRGRLILVVLGLCILFSGLTYVLIAFTPLKRTIPGFESDTMRSNQIEMYRRLLTLQEELNSKVKYAEIIDPTLEDFKVNKDSIDVVELPTSQEKNPNLKQYLPEHYLKASEGAVKSLNNYHFFKPINGLVSQPYDPIKKHYAIDVVASKNEPVKAALSGKVIFSAWTSETGHVLAIQHPNDIITFYKHNSVLFKKEGEFVKAGEVVGVVGNSGEFSTGPHLHFEIWQDGQPLNPEEVIVFE